LNADRAPELKADVAASLESMLKRNAFLIAFLGSLLVFAAVNWLIYLAVNDSGSTPEFCALSYAIGGFPFPWYSKGGSVGHPNVDWFAVKVNVATAIVASYVIGRIIKWVFIEPATIHPTLKPFG
jgi:hypothetical protein